MNVVTGKSDKTPYSLTLIVSPFFGVDKHALPHSSGIFIDIQTSVVQCRDKVH